MANADAIAAPDVGRVIADLEAHAALISNCAASWQRLVARFAALDETLAARSRALDADYEKLDAATNTALAAIAAREAAIPERQAAGAAVIVSRRDAAVEAIQAADQAAAPTDIKGVLRWHSVRMDATQLWRFVSSRRRDLAAVRRELIQAIVLAVDPLRLVIDAVTDFVETDGSADQCWVLGMLLRAVWHYDGRKVPEIAESLQQRAAAAAEKWLKKFWDIMVVEKEDKENEVTEVEEENSTKVGKETDLESEKEEEIDAEVDKEKENEKETEGDKDGEGEARPGHAAAQIFLQIVAAFNIKSRFEDAILRRLFIEHVRRKELTRLAPLLGCNDCLGDVIKSMIDSGKGIEAVYIVKEMGLLEQFPPAPILKTLLQLSREKTTKGGKRAHEESSNAELNTTKAIIKCVETCKLKSYFNVEGLKKKLEKIEKERAEKKGAQRFSKKARAAGPVLHRHGRGAPAPRSSAYRGTPSAARLYGYGATPPGPYSGAGYGVPGGSYGPYDYAGVPPQM